jgi:methylated-DNA-[protein]-cysteine S-methyltransferase
MSTGKEMSATLQWMMESKIGRLYLVASEKGLQGVFWRKRKDPMAPSLVGELPQQLLLARAVRELEEYFNGRRRKFEVPLDARGTSFQLRVWKELARIPYGSTCSYGQLASRLRSPRAVRAVGAANGRNPLSVVVPCHRVIASDGALRGYSGGLSTKAKLLEIEKSFLAKLPVG